MSNATTYTAPDVFMAKGNTYSNTKPWFSLWRNFGGGCRPIILSISDATASNFSMSTPGCAFPWTDTQWHHLAFTVDRAGRATIYVDGVEKVSSDVSAENLSISTAGSLFLGAHRNINGVDPGSANAAYFTGDLDDVRLYNRVLSGSEIRMLYEGSCESPPRLPGTLLYNSSTNHVQYCDGVSWVKIE